jgi:hypothetical protein
MSLEDWILARGHMHYPTRARQMTIICLTHDGTVFDIGRNPTAQGTLCEFHDERITDLLSWFDESAITGKVAEADKFLHVTMWNGWNAATPCSFREKNDNPQKRRRKILRRS